MTTSTSETFFCEKFRATMRVAVCLMRQDARYTGRKGMGAKPTYEPCARGPDIARPQCAQGAIVRLNVGNPAHSQLQVARMRDEQEDFD